MLIYILGFLPRFLPDIRASLSFPSFCSVERSASAKYFDEIFLAFLRSPFHTTLAVLEAFQLEGHAACFIILFRIAEGKLDVGVVSRIYVKGYRARQVSMVAILPAKMLRRSLRVFFPRCRTRAWLDSLTPVQPGLPVFLRLLAILYHPVPLSLQWLM